MKRYAFCIRNYVHFVVFVQGGAPLSEIRCYGVVCDQNTGQLFVCSKREDEGYVVL